MFAEWELNTQDEDQQEVKVQAGKSGLRFYKSLTHALA